MTGAFGQLSGYVREGQLVRFFVDPLHTQHVLVTGFADEPANDERFFAPLVSA